MKLRRSLPLQLTYSNIRFRQSWRRMVNMMF
nr:MAG TPA: hypothetical protein [Caudoviricetes sp.]